MSYGYIGKFLHIDLTTCNIDVKEPEDKLYRLYAVAAQWGHTTY
jgi:aldehyde:ferredoxin oxidoreductase